LLEDVYRNSAAWALLGAELPRPKAILVISAHWAAKEPTVSTVGTPETIHDFGGFPAALYGMNYPAPGAPALAARVAEDFLRAVALVLLAWAWSQILATSTAPRSSA
jgi:4,5-DOPA dioxygenase extradiol